MFEKLLPYDAAHLILGAYLKYYHQYKRITKRAQIRFENRDWHGSQADSRERLTLYRNQVGRTTEKVLEFLGERANDRVTWKRIKENYLDEVINFNTRNIAETFYNSVFRHSHKGLSVDEDLMFVHATGTYREFRSTVPIYQTFFLVRPIEHVVRQLFSFYSFDAKWEDMERDIGYITTVLNKKILEGRDALPRNARLEMLKSIFFRNKGAYIVGRLHLEDRIFPFIMPLLHEENGIYVDALLVEYNEVSSIFSYNRSYFLVDVDIVSEMVDFLLSILPTKNMGELYNSIGFEKHGKTVLYRDFLRHLDRSYDQFVIAPGIKGMVMSVFTLHSYNMVFKVIKDSFAAPKKVTEQEVKEKYEVVFFHDRVGRMADSHMFENFTIPRERVSQELLDELLKEAASKVRLYDDIVEIKHLYIEKKMIPLNLYLESATPEEAEEVINEYGKAIKQLAAVNIFPGDMLLKNFGVTRLKRVVFYDYDEIGFLTDYNFRRIPEPRDYYDELSSEPWYSVGPNDVFPEEFPRFLIGRKDIRDIFYKLHGDLYDVTFWRGVQERLRGGEIFDVFPYRQRLRFRKMFRKNNKGLSGDGPSTGQP
ncbi:MAG: bifunctional isocitrate dehydrogenase kinase/phosphatase [Phaeodactylibacter sp.]|nr:bifunctional isocitrate dehydrogenase kinase/phosphatase [Phaeodactylibacter sp.]MCB9049581.1 bifunctional isocitrate dehydrogenase kinase/phosphatase [Lewinellaceae bacterium]